MNWSSIYLLYHEVSEDTQGQTTLDIHRIRPCLATVDPLVTLADRVEDAVGTQWSLVFYW